MPKHTRGEQGPRGPVIVKTSEHKSMRKIRCPKCHGMAVPTRKANGQQVYKCGGVCQTEFKSTRM